MHALLVYFHALDSPTASAPFLAQSSIVGSDSSVFPRYFDITSESNGLITQCTPMYIVVKLDPLSTQLLEEMPWPVSFMYGVTSIFKLCNMLHQWLFKLSVQQVGQNWGPWDLDTYASPRHEARTFTSSSLPMQWTELSSALFSKTFWEVP